MLPTVNTNLVALWTGRTCFTLLAPIGAIANQQADKCSDAWVTEITGNISPVKINTNGYVCSRSAEVKVGGMEIRLN